MSLEQMSYDYARVLREETLRRMLDLDQFRAAVRSGAFRPIRMMGAGTHFWIEGQPVGKGKPRPEESMVLCTSRTRVHRYFRNPAAALELLWKIGVQTVEIHMKNWHPDHAKFARGLRPDMADRLRFAHEYAVSGAESSEAQAQADCGAERREADREFDWPEK
jgi:hypothetical protein